MCGFLAPFLFVTWTVRMDEPVPRAFDEQDVVHPSMNVFVSLINVVVVFGFQCLHMQEITPRYPSQIK